MPINVFGSSNSNNSDNEIVTSLFVQKHYLRSNYIESNIEEDIDLKNQFRIINLPDLVSEREPVSKDYVDNKFNDPSIIKNTEHIDLNDRNITNARFIQVNQLPQIDSHLTAKLYVDNAIDEPSLSRLDPDGKLERGHILLNSILTTPRTILEIPTKNYVDNKFNDPSIIKNSDHVEFNDKNLDNVRWLKVNKMPAFPEHLTPKVHVDYAIDEPSLLRLDPDEKLNLDEQDSILLNSTLTLPNRIIELPTKSYVDSLHESSRNRRDLSSIFNGQDNEFHKNNITNLDSITVNRNPNLDNELANKKYIDDELDKNTVLRFIQ